MNARCCLLWGLTVALLLCVSCDDNESGAAPETDEKHVSSDDDTEDDSGSSDGKSSDKDTGVDSDSGDKDEGTASSDVSKTPCDWKPKVKPQVSGKYPGIVSKKSGVDAMEKAAYDTLRDALLEDPNVHFVATFDTQKKQYVVTTGKGDDTHELRFTRFTPASGGVNYQIDSGELKAVFPNANFTVHGGYDELLAAFENPNNVSLEDKGYKANDPRVGFLPHEQQSYPWALLRLAVLFDAPDAPDIIYARYPWASGSTGTHGGMSLLQSRSSLIMSGAGVKSGHIHDEQAFLVDVAPTVLALLGAETTGGIGPDGSYDEGLYLKRQDGRVLWEALDLDACVRPEHVVIIDYDGLLANEINHVTLNDVADLALPNLSKLAKNGSVYRYGAMSNFPSVSAPGHMTIGSGLWNGNSGVIANAYFRRKTQEIINPFILLDDPIATLKDPDKVWKTYESMVVEGMESLPEAAHRGLGKWDAESGEGAFVAVVNDVAIKGADWTTLDYAVESGIASDPKAAMLEFNLADEVAILQVQTLLDDAEKPVPSILLMSLFSTDKIGEATGPHSNALREELIKTDERLGKIMAAYEARDALSKTMFVLVSDHGMELQDPSRTSQAGAKVKQSGVSVKEPFGGLIYLRIMQIKKAFNKTDRTLEVTVLNYDNNTPLEGVVVSCDGCTGEAKPTDPKGWVVFDVPEETNKVVLSAEHTDFNPQTLDVAL